MKDTVAADSCCCGSADAVVTYSGSCGSETGIICGTGSVKVTFTAMRLPGGDLACTLTGGTLPHTGAVCLAYFEDGKVICRSLSAPGHRDSKPAEDAARMLCCALKVNVSVSAGLHIDNASPEQIRTLCYNSTRAVLKYLEVI